MKKSPKCASGVYVSWGAGVDAHHCHPRRPPIAPPIFRGRAACRIRRRRPWGATPHLWRRLETRVACSVLGWLGCRGVWVDMAERVMGSGSGPWPRGRACYGTVSIKPLINWPIEWARTSSVSSSCPARFCARLSSGCYSCKLPTVSRDRRSSCIVSVSDYPAEPDDLLRHLRVLLKGSVPQPDSFCPSLPITMSGAPPADLDPNNNPTESVPAADADGEPQNALTQKFTEKEWAALKEFRVSTTHQSPSHFSMLFLLFRMSSRIS